MTENIIPTPLPDNVMIVDDNGAPLAMLDLDQMQGHSIALAYDMAQHCGDPDALDEVSAKWIDKVGVDAFGYVAAGALRLMAHNILEPTLQAVDRLAPTLNYRGILADAARNAEEVLR